MRTVNVLLLVAVVITCAGGAFACVKLDKPEKPDEVFPSFLAFARQAKSPLITDAYPLHKAVSLFDLPGVKAALAKGDNPNQAVGADGGAQLSGSYTPMRVAVASVRECGSGCAYVPGVLGDIMIQLLCAGANPNERGIQPSNPQSTPLSQLVRMAPYNLFYALMLAGADVPSAEVAAEDDCGGPRGHSDMGSALTAAVLVAFGADIRPKNPAEYYKYNKNCVRPPGDDSLCYSLCAIRRDGFAATEASELRAGRISPSLATKLELSGTQKKVHSCTLEQINAELAEIAAIFKACPAVAKKKSGK